jgi:diphthine synthase
MLYLIGMGLCDAQDLTLRALTILRTCEHIYLESYTSKLQCSVEQLSESVGQPIKAVDRTFVEQQSDIYLEQAKNKNVALLIIGDVFGATTHTDIFLRAHKAQVKVEVVHNTSILTAVGTIGLELYKYGRTASMPYFAQGFTPATPYNIVKDNLSLGLHTLLLTDIQADKNKYMTVKECLQQCLELEKSKRLDIFSKETLVIGCARLGCPDRVIKYGTIAQLMEFDFGAPLHCVVIPGKLHFVEEEMLALWR